MMEISGKHNQCLHTKSISRLFEWPKMSSRTTGPLLNERTRECLVWNMTVNSPAKAPRAMRVGKVQKEATGTERQLVMKSRVIKGSKMFRDGNSFTGIR
jgi:hypothetical protein